ncbi:MAG: hypothetical protein JRI95_09160 [Deltaproteobacteria bacterium]|nr:hypothetical protein [Deltaproteobacteria bacterium]MBW2086310.1 hypothetical protein [Deltaproteobacteria bacterium]
MSNKKGPSEHRGNGFKLLALLAPLLLVGSPALAHRVNIFAWVEGDTVYTESYFSGGKKVRNGLVEVFDLAGKKLLQGRTNEKGEFSFKFPQKSSLHIVLTASMGHRSEFTLRAEEPSEELAGSARQEAAATARAQTPALVDLEQIRAVVEETLDARLKPISRTLAEMQKPRGPSLTEIIGGLGYIFGIMGLIMYFRSRKKTEQGPSH